MTRPRKTRRPTGRCPGCGGPLRWIADEREGVRPGTGLHCSQCEGVVLNHGALSGEAREWLRGFVPAPRRELRCPFCPGTMRTVRRDGHEVESCESCGAVFLDPGTDHDAAAEKARTLFALSIPERAVRSILGTAGAAAREITHVLIPPALRRTRIWSAAIERTLKILAEGVGHVPSQEKEGKQVDVARMAVGSVVDTTALVLFQLSPLWLLAVVYDVAKGSRTYLDEVVREMKDRRLLAKQARVTSVDQLLAALERTSGELQADVDLPPLSAAELRKSVARIRESIAARPKKEVEAAARELASELEETSRKEGRTRKEISDAVVLGAATRAQFAKAAAKASVDVAARLLVERGWKPYVEQLRAVREEGFAHYLAAASKPIAEGVAKTFDPKTDTVTAQLVSGRLWRRAMEMLQRVKPVKKRAAGTKSTSASVRRARRKGDRQ